MERAKRTERASSDVPMISATLPGLSAGIDWVVRPSPDTPERSGRSVTCAIPLILVRSSESSGRCRIGGHELTVTQELANPAALMPKRMGSRPNPSDLGANVTWTGSELSEDGANAETRTGVRKFVRAKVGSDTKLMRYPFSPKPVSDRITRPVEPSGIRITS